jgi:leader peptidase (prepilin peptidase)/N-methyltransferase
MPDWLTTLASGVFGLIIGSFVNVVVIRLPKNKSIVRPSSCCPKCKRPIRWWDNVPVLSYLALRGKCRSCSKPISIRYPIIELLTALLFVTVKIRFGWSSLLFFHDWPFMAMLVAITFIDLEHRIIPDPLSLGGLALGLLTCWAVPELGWVRSFSGAALGFSLFYGLAWAYQALKGRSGLGGGDIKLLAMLGSFVGPSGVFTTILISSVFGSIVGISWGFFQGKKNLMNLSLPFGPFLVIGALYYYLFGDLLWFQFMTPM